MTPSLSRSSPRSPEMFGMPDVSVECPVCEQGCETIYVDANNEAVGCEHCMRKKRSWDWFCIEQEKWRPEE